MFSTTGRDSEALLLFRSHSVPIYTIHEERDRLNFPNLPQLVLKVQSAVSRTLWSSLSQDLRRKPVSFLAEFSLCINFIFFKLEVIQKSLA